MSLPVTDQVRAVRAFDRALGVAARALKRIEDGEGWPEALPVDLQEPLISRFNLLVAKRKHVDEERSTIISLLLKAGIDVMQHHSVVGAQMRSALGLVGTSHVRHDRTVDNTPRGV